MNEWEVVARTVAALLAGGAIGLERSYHGRAAGLRTYALVCFGSALLVDGETGRLNRAWLESLVADLLRLRERGSK